MGLNLGQRLSHGWNAFWGRDHPTRSSLADYGPSYSVRPDKLFFSYGNEKTIVSTIINRIAIDASSIDLRHVRVDENGNYTGEIGSGLNHCLNVRANIDQTGRSFLLDVYESLLDEGYIGIVPVDTALDPKVTGSYDIKTLRVGRIVQWHPKAVTLDLYNENTGLRENITLPKTVVAIVENPFYRVMNEPNSTLKRLNRKICLLDSSDEKASSEKLDLIIQLPYAIQTESKRKLAEERKKDIEFQLSGSKYGIAYVGATERVTQLNRAIENNFQEQVEYLTQQLFTQMGITPEILNGTATEDTMTNYYSRIIEPIVSAVCNAIDSTFLSKTARSRRQAIKFFREPFKITSPTRLAEIADRLTRNEILSSNEFRAIIGYKPSTDPRADELRNKNIASNYSYPGDMYDEELDGSAGYDYE